MQPRTGEGDLTHIQANIQATGIMGVDRTRHDTVGVGRLGDGVGAMGICKEVSMVEGGGVNKYQAYGSSGSPRLLPATHPPQRLQRVKVAGGGGKKSVDVVTMCSVGEGREGACKRRSPRGRRGGGEQAWGWLRVSDLWLHTGENVGGPKVPASVYTRGTPQCGYP